MWVFAILIAAAAIYFGAHDVALAQATTPNVTPPFQGLSTPVTSTVTNCMMSCNSQVSNCQTGCVIPAPPTTTPIGKRDLKRDIEYGLRNGLYFEPASMSDELRPTILPNWKIKRAAVRFRGIQRHSSYRAAPPLPAALVRRGDRRLLHRPRRERAGAHLRLWRG